MLVGTNVSLAYASNRLSYRGNLLRVRPIAHLRISSDEILKERSAVESHVEQAFVRTYKVSKTFEVPLTFAYDWCTDFREDDPKMVGSRNMRHILERAENRVVWVVNRGKTGKAMDSIRVVWLSPPDSWHLETCGDETEVGDYKLTSLGKNRTRLDMTFRATYYDRESIEDKAEWEADTKQHWDRYGEYLEKDYQNSLR